MRTIITILSAAALAVACTMGGPGTDPTTTPPVPTAAATPEVTLEPSPALPTPPAATTTPVATETTQETPELPDLVGEVPEDVLLEIMQETSRATGANLAELTVERAEAVTWSDASLGCPEPGQSYIQVLTDGYWVVIEAGGDTYDFRVSQSGDWRVCPEGQGQPPIDEQY